MAWVMQAASLLMLSTMGASQSSQCVPIEGTVYDYSFTSVDESTPINLSDYQGQVLLVVNVATY